MQRILLPLFVLAAVGFFASLLLHLLAWGGINPFGDSPGFVAMHLGVFVLWLPAVLVTMRMQSTTRDPAKRWFWRGSMMSWNKALSGSPVWMRYGVYAAFAYSIVSIVFLSQDARDHVALPGTTNVATLRLFSASWMLFYGAASAIFYSAFRKPSLITQRKCPQGHLVAESDQFCATCGTSLASRAST